MQQGLRPYLDAELEREDLAMQRFVTSIARKAAEDIDGRIAQILERHAPRRGRVMRRFPKRWVALLLGIRISCVTRQADRTQRWSVRVGRTLREFTIAV